MSENPKKVKILWWSDTPTCETGFAQVAKQILKRLHNTGKYDITIVGINHFDSYYDQEVYPYKIFSGAIENDVYGFKQLARFLKDLDFDVFFSLNDEGVLNHIVPLVKEARKQKKFKWIIYSPIDVDGACLSVGMHRCLFEADYTVMYTQWGKEQVEINAPDLSPKLEVIYHGTEPETFYPLPENKRREIRSKAFSIDDDMLFLIGNVNRNQWRKDIPRTMKAFKIFKDTIKAPAKLYLHSAIKDLGGNLAEQAFALGLDIKKDVIFTGGNFDVAKGVPRERMNWIYNSLDLLISTTLGEGWGLSTTEAFCSKTPVIVPRNTSNLEIVGDEERGLFAECGTTSSEWIVPVGNDTNYPRPLVNVDSMVEKMIQAYYQWKSLKEKSNPKDWTHRGTHLRQRLNLAHDWAVENSWDKIGAQWVSLFEKAGDKLALDRNDKV